MAVTWVGGTVRCDDGPGVGWGLIRTLGGPSRLARETARYRHGVFAEDGGWMVAWDGQGSNVGTVLVTVRQRHLEAVDGTALTLDLLARGLRPSRIDLAGDDLSLGARRPRAYFVARDGAWTRTHRDGWVLHESGDGRQTLEVGSRSSERFLRLYDHAPGVLRHELELKGSVAAATGAAMALGARVSDLWASEYARLVRWA